MYNAIRLLKCEATLTSSEYKEFTVGDTLCNENIGVSELMHWDISQKKEALNILSNYLCKHEKHNEENEVWSITEYALEFCERNSNGEVVSGGDFYIAKLDPAGLPQNSVTALLSSKNYMRLKPTDPRKEIKELREKIGMSQSAFASYFELPVRSLQEWEQERKSPPPYLPKLLKRIIVLEYFKNT